MIGKEIDRRFLEMKLYDLESQFNIWFNHDCVNSIETGESPLNCTNVLILMYGYIRFSNQHISILGIHFYKTQPSQNIEYIFVTVGMTTVKHLVAFYKTTLLQTIWKGPRSVEFYIWLTKRYQGKMDRGLIKHLAQTPCNP